MGDANSTLTHLNQAGDAHMVDVSEKEVTTRVAVAEGAVHMRRETLELIIADGLPKGDVLATARIAGIMAAKRTHELIPLCHPLALSKVEIELLPSPPDVDRPHIGVRSTVKLKGKTGVEMEALTAVSVACLTLYDMAKAVDKAMEITDVRLVTKSGGKSGDLDFGSKLA